MTDIIIRTRWLRHLCIFKVILCIKHVCSLSLRCQTEDMYTIMGDTVSTANQLFFQNKDVPGPIYNTPIEIQVHISAGWQIHQIYQLVSCRDICILYTEPVVKVNQGPGRGGARPWLLTRGSTSHEMPRALAVTVNFLSQSWEPSLVSLTTITTARKSSYSYRIRIWSHV